MFKIFVIKKMNEVMMELEEAFLKVIYIVKL